MDFHFVKISSLFLDIFNISADCARGIQDSYLEIWFDDISLTIDGWDH